MMYWRLFRVVMKLAHRFNWHYAPPVYPDGDTQLWCQWCGFRQTIRRHGAINATLKYVGRSKFNDNSGKVG